MASSLPEPDGPRRVADESLVAQARNGGAEAYDRLVSRYHGLVRLRAAARLLRGGDPDDLIQEGLIGLYKAVRDFRPEHGTGFRRFAEACIDRELTNHGGSTQ
jgi:RNA polymerase sporulation-specific sigma factor